MTRARGHSWASGAASIALLCGAWPAFGQDAPAEPTPADPAPAEPAPAEAPAEEKGEPAYDLGEEPGALDTTIDKFKTPVDRLSEHYLGSTSKPVRFDWRRSWVILGVHGSELIERNNFGSFRVGGVVRKALLSLMLEAGVNYVFVLPTESSRLLGLTPYVQPSRPSRVEIDINLSYPLFEGVMTPLFDFIPPSELVFNVTAGGRYLFYPDVLIGDRNWRSPGTYTEFATWRDIATSLGTAQLLETDIVILERRRLSGMRIDPALIHTLVGFTVDAYYQPGVFFSGRALLNIPALSVVNGTRLGFFWELSLFGGWAF